MHVMCVGGEPGQVHEAREANSEDIADGEAVEERLARLIGADPSKVQ